MSAERIENSIIALYQEHKVTSDIVRLKVIREKLLQLGAWTESEYVRLKIQKLQEKMENTA